MNKFWNKIVNEAVSNDHRDKVFAAAKTHLDQKKVPMIWRWSISFALTAAAMTGLWLYTHQMDLEIYENKHTTGFYELEVEEIEDLDLISELEMIEEMEVLDQWSSI